ncbi:MAG: hypothetical protein DYH12_33035 [Sorangiineae bacterium PRO1]|nr:hypothetical protein [Sorangiineae bacterium PRO1]
MHVPRLPIPRELSVAIALGLAACGGGSSGELMPQANVAESLGAQRDFRDIHRLWTSSRPADRARLEPAIVSFLDAHSRDRRARTARVYLAWLYVQRGRVAEARALVQEIRQGPGGTVRDFAAVAEAAILLREGKPDQALSVLTPLEGKIIDPDERFLFGEQRVVAALGARRPGLAVRAMRDWLAETAPEERDAVRGRIIELSAQIAAEPLFRSLTELLAEEGSANVNPEKERARSFLVPLVAERLAKLCVQHEDGALARRLLDTGLPLFRRGELGQELVRIAASGSVLPRVAGRSLGLVLSIGSAEQRRRSAQVATGVSRALGLPASAADREAVQLVTSEDDGSEHGVAHALAELAGEGAAILIAGIDEASAVAAAKYSANTGIPVLLLAPAPARGGAEFVIAETPERESQALLEGATALSLDKRASVGRGGVPCDAAPSAAGQPRFPVLAWKKERVDGVLVTGDAVCAREVARETQESGRRVTLGLGLEAGEVFAELEPGQPRFALSAGAFPHRPGTAAPESQKKLVVQSGHAPSWYTTLGHDAAVLARQALSELPLERADDARVVAELHRRAKERLAVAEGELWSSEHAGFAGKRVLPRTLGSVVWSRGKGAP